MNDDFLAGYDADARYLGRARNLAVIGHVPRKRRQLQERRSRVEQGFDAVANEHLVLATKPFPVTFGANVARDFLAFLQLRGEAPVVQVVGAVIVVARVDQGADALHFN